MDGQVFHACQDGRGATLAPRGSRRPFACQHGSARSYPCRQRRSCVSSLPRLLAPLPQAAASTTEACSSAALVEAVFEDLARAARPW